MTRVWQFLKDDTSQNGTPFYEKMKIYPQVLTFFIKPKTWLFHVVVLLTTATKWTKVKNARARRAKLLLSLTKYANLWRSRCRRRCRCLSSLISYCLNNYCPDMEVPGSILPFVNNKIIHSSNFRKSCSLHLWRDFSQFLLGCHLIKVDKILTCNLSQVCTNLLLVLSFYFINFKLSSNITHIKLLSHEICIANSICNLWFTQLMVTMKI